MFNRMTKRCVRLGEQELDVFMTRKAATMLDEQSEPLHITMELYFSCLIKKQVKFTSAPQDNTSVQGSINDHVALGFRSVQTKTCRVESLDDPIPQETFPVERPGMFIPRWLVIEVRDGQLQGTWGYRAERPHLAR